MSYNDIIPDPNHPQTFMNCDPNLLTAQQYLMALYNHGHKLISQGCPPEELTDPAIYFNMETDWDAFLNVVNNWQHGAVKPDAYGLLIRLRAMGGRHTTFAAELEFDIARYTPAGKPGRVPMPAAERAERDAQLNRDRVSRHRQRQSLDGNANGDQRLAELMWAHESARRSFVQGEAWASNRKSELRDERDAAIVAAKAAYKAQCEEVDGHVFNARSLVAEAKERVSEYKAAKQ